MDLENAKKRILNDYQEKYDDGSITEEFCYDYVKRLILLEVKQYHSEGKRHYTELLYSNPEERLTNIRITTNMLSILTPTEFMNLFPITKVYDGKKYGLKDYYSTMEYIKTLPQDKPITPERINEFLMEYYNPDIEILMVDAMMAASNMMRQETGEGLVEKMGIPAVEIHEGTNGQKYVIDENGKSKPVIEKKKRPKYLKLVK